MKADPTFDELAAVIVGYYQARQAVNDIKSSQPRETAPLFDELLCAERVVMYAGRLLTRGAGVGQAKKGEPKILPMCHSDAKAL
jgi:hypothetical protein